MCNSKHNFWSDITFEIEGPHQKGARRFRTRWVCKYCNVEKWD